MSQPSSTHTTTTTTTTPTASADQQPRAAIPSGCPECGGGVVPASACLACPTCGWSRCH